MDVVSSLPQVLGDLVYLAKMPEKPHIYTYDPPDGGPKTNIVTNPIRCRSSTCAQWQTA